MRARRGRFFEVCGALGLVALAGPVPAQANPQVVGRYESWIAMRDEAARPRLCFLAVPPSVSVPTVPERGRAALVVQHQAGGQDTVLLLTGLQTQGTTAEVSVDGVALAFTPTASGLVAGDIAHTLATMNTGGTLALRLTDRGQTIVEDHYPLAGFREGYRESRAGCDGVPFPAAQIPAAPAPIAQNGALPAVMGPAGAGADYSGSGGGRHEVQLHHWQGVATLPVLVDGGTHVEFVLDSGAATVQIPEDVFARMQANGATPPVIGQVTSHIANGSSFQSRVIRLDAVQIGGVTVTNVLCTIAPRGSPPLLGQTVLQKFPNWSVDNQRGVFRWGQ